MLIKLVKSVEVDVPTNDPEEAMNIVDAMDSDGSLELIAEYFDVSTGEQLN